MREFLALSSNLTFVEGDDGKMEPLAELIFLHSEPVYSLDATGCLAKARDVGNFRLSITGKSLRRLSEGMLSLADDMDASEERLASRQSEPASS